MPVRYTIRLIYTQPLLHLQRYHGYVYDVENSYQLLHFSKRSFQCNSKCWKWYRDCCNRDSHSICHHLSSYHLVQRSPLQGEQGVIRVGGQKCLRLSVIQSILDDNDGRTADDNDASSNESTSCDDRSKRVDHLSATTAATTDDGTTAAANDDGEANDDDATTSDDDAAASDDDATAISAMKMTRGRTY